VLRPWSRQVIVAIAPDRLSALLVGGTLRRRLLDRQAVPLPVASTSWEQTMTAFEELFAETSWRGHRLHIVLSNHHANYQALQQTNRLTATERLALATIKFAETYGQLSESWEIRVSPPGIDGATLACGVPSQLLDDLRSHSQGKARLRAIQPVMMPLFNQTRTRIGHAAGYLVLVEESRLTIAIMEDGRCLSVSSRAASGRQLAHLLHEESDLHQRLPGGLLWVCDLTNNAQLPTDPAWIPHLIPPPVLAGLAGKPDLASWGLA
jgi:hypothetical protein